MDKDELRVRAEKRRKLAQVADAQDSLVAEIGTAWLQEAALKWNPDVQPKVPAGVPVGPDFLRFVKTWMKSNKFRTLEFGEAAVKAGAEAVASWIDFNGSRVVGIDYPNPLTEINKAKGEGWSVGASDNKQTKTAESVYGPIDRESVGLYTEPEEWSRYCPEHAGVMMRRVKDGVYQCPMKGEVFSYTDGHDVEIKIGVQNQTNPNWNKTFPQKGFLDTPNQQSFEKKKHPEYKENKDTSYQETEDLYVDDKQSKKKASFKPFSKKAESLGIMHKMFAPTIRHSRYCPEHPGVSLYRIADSVFQCPLDRVIYDYEKGFTTQDGKEHNGGNVAEMTPDFPEFYQSPHPFLMKGSVKGFMKKALQPVKLEPTPEYEKKSALERFIAQTKTWGKDKPLEEAQKETLDFLQSTKINPRNKAQMMAKVQNQPNVEELVFYLWQSLLAGSGMRTSSLKVAETNLEYRIARDIDLALRGDENSKKMLGLMIDGVFKGKSMMLAAKEAYDFVEKANQPAPKTIEVQEEPPVSPGQVPPIGAIKPQE